MTSVKIISNATANLQESHGTAPTLESSIQDAKDLQSSSRVPRVDPINVINEQKSECSQCGGQHNYPLQV